MTNNKNKTAIETINSQLDRLYQIDSDNLSVHHLRAILTNTLEILDARLSDIEARLGSFKHDGNIAHNLEQLNDRLNALETSAKASEPKECICPNYRTVSCPVHDGDESTSVEKIEQPSLQLAIFQMKKLIDLARDDVAFAFKNHSLHQLQINIVKSYEYALEILERNSKKEEK